MLFEDFFICLLVEVEGTEWKGRDKCLLTLMVPSSQLRQLARSAPPSPPPLHVKDDIFAVVKNTSFSVPCKKHQGR